MSNCIFTVWVPFSRKICGVSRGVKSLGSGFPIGASSTLLAHDFPLESLVCYTFVPSAVKRMSVAILDIRLFIGAEQADKFREEQKKFVFSDCSGKEQTVYINPRRSGRKTFASTTQKLRVCSQNKTLSNSSLRDIITTEASRKN